MLIFNKRTAAIQPNKPFKFSIKINRFTWQPSSSHLPYGPAHDKTDEMGCAPSADSDQPGHPPTLIRVFAVRMKKAWVLSYLLSAQRRLWSDWANAQADPSLRWAQMPFCWFCLALAHIVDTFFDVLGPVVQSVVSLTSSLRVISLTVLADSIYNILIFFAEKMWVAFALQKLLTFFQQKISAYLRITRCKF